MTIKNWYCTILWLWFALAVEAQTKNKVLPSLDSTWERLAPIAISPNGDWAVFKKMVENGEDTTYLINPKLKKEFKSAKSDIRFLNDHWATISNIDGTRIIELSRGQLKPFIIKGQIEATGSQQYWFVKNGSELSFINLDGNKVFQLSDVSLHVLDPKKEKLLIRQQVDNTTILSIVDVHSLRQDTVLNKKEISIEKMVWSKEGTAFAFTKIEDKNNRELLFHHSFHTGETNEITLELPDSVHTYTITPRFIDRTLDLAILVHSTYLNAESNAEFVDIWKGNDRQLNHKAYPNFNKFLRKTRTFYWSATSTKVEQINDEIRDYVAPLGAQGQFLLADMVTDRDYRHHMGYITLYLKDMRDGRLRLIADSIVQSYDQVKVSSSGEWIAFRRDDGKYHDHHFGTYPVTVYNTVTEKATVIDLPDAQGKLAWSKDERALILTNVDGLWKWDTRTGILQSYFSIGNVPQSIDILNIGYGASEIDLSQPVLIQAVNLNNNDNQVVRLFNGKAQILAPSSPNRIAQTVFTSNGSIALYTIENYDLPHVMQYVQLGEKPRVLLKSNTHVHDMPVNRQEILTYTNQYNQELKGTLYYPQNFDSTQTYPMVVHIYESQFYLANRFMYPHLHNGIGYNISLLTQEGYFVYQPDIVYNEEGPGLSALDCVRSAMRAAYSIKQIDFKKVGLIGQSFGSYETNFLITHSDMFAAAVSGNGLSDLLMSYYSFNYNYYMPTFNRYETGQFRMFSPYYADKEKYRRNSPIEFAHQVKTPVLLWAGQQDLNVPWKQTENFYTALRRFDVPQMALFYKQEGHILVEPETQKHLTLSVLDWFSYYLKDHKQISWIKEGVVQSR